MHIAPVLFAFLLVAAAVPALAQDKPLQPRASTAKGAPAVTTPWARATPGGAKVGAAFFAMQAAPGAPDKLVAAKSPAAGVVELHNHVSEGGVMKMRRVDGIAVAAGAKVDLKPGSYHVMLMDLKAPLKEGDTIDLTLVFEKAGEVPVKVPVLKVGSPGPGGQGKGHGGHGKH